MSVKRKIVYSVLLCLLISFCALVSLSFFLPTLLNSEWFAQIEKDAGVNDFSWNIRRIGLTGADIGDLRIGVDKKNALSVQAVQIDYSVEGLYNRRIQRILISGVEFYCGIKNGRFIVRGLNLESILARFKTKKTTPHPSGIGTSLPIKEAEIRDAVIYLDWEGQPFQIPVALKLTAQTNDIIKGSLSALVRGRPIAAFFDFDLQAKTVHLKKIAGSFHLEQFRDLAARIPGLEASGDLNISGKAKFKLTPFQISSVQASCEIKNPIVAYDRSKLKTARENAVEDKPYRIEVRSTDGYLWVFSAPSAVIASPAPLRISGINASLLLKPGGIKCTGDFLLKFEPSGLRAVYTVETIKPLISKWNFAAATEKNGNWELNLTNTATDIDLSGVWAIRFDEKRITARTPKIDMTARGKSGNISATYNVEIQKVDAGEGRTGIRLPSLQVKGNAEIHASGETRATVNVSAPNTDMRHEGATVRLPETVLSVKLNRSKDKALYFDGVLNTLNGKIEDPKTKLRISGVNVAFPFEWPWKSSRRAGKMVVGSFRWDRFDLGSFNGIVRQDGPGLRFNGTYKSNLLPGFNMSINGESVFLPRKIRTKVDFDSLYNIPKAMNLGKFHAPAKGVSATGVLTINGNLIADNAGMKCTVNANLDNGTVRISKKAAAAENIRLKLSIPDVLKKLHSEPRQHLMVETVSLGNISLRDARIDYQIESDQSILIEKVNFNWCGGRVSTLAMRIKPGVEDYELTLYCDRLNLAELLMQFGIARAEGKGAVSGRIHVRLKNGEISFEDGFLFSTPGEGGTIFLTGAELLTAGLSKNTPQYAQIDLAREALKDYRYKWVRLRLTTEAEKLLMKMEFDGKPANPLPFVYKKELGGFVRDASGKQLSNFQGIRLNVNLGVPLNRILRYKGILDKINN